MQKKVISQNYGQYKHDIFKKMNLGFEVGKKILDVGCGDGSDAKIFIEEFKLDTYGIDVYEDCKIVTIEGLKFIKAGIGKIPFPENSFDYVFLHDVLHHVDEEKQSYNAHVTGLLELKRICKPNGEIIIVEGNRYNPLFYPHMVLIKRHNHFRQTYFKKIVNDVFKDVVFKFFECHSYPKLFVKFWKKYEWVMEASDCLKSFRAYNLAIIKNKKNEYD